jgi:hypothetical protein
MLRRVLLGIVGLSGIAAVALTTWIAWPTRADLALPAPLEAWRGDPPSEPYSQDFTALVEAFRPQVHRSFCGPATIETVLRAYGNTEADQANIFPSFLSKLDTFYSGMSLAELADLSRSVGLHAEVVYANAFDVESFRSRLKDNLARAGDFVVVNYDRRVLNQSGAGHISTVAAYDEAHDAFLVLDEAAYRYPFTWIPTPLLYEAVHTRAGEHFRGVLFVSAPRQSTEGT